MNMEAASMAMVIALKTVKVIMRAIVPPETEEETLKLSDPEYFQRIFQLCQLKQLL